MLGFIFELRGRIYTAAGQVTPEVLYYQVWQEIDFQWDAWRIINGSHIEHIYFKVKQT